MFEFQGGVGVQTECLEYRDHFELRRVSANACIRWKRRAVCVGTVLTHLTLGLEETGDGRWTVYLNTFILGELNENDYKMTDRFNKKRTKPQL